MSRTILQTLERKLEARPHKEALPECYGEFGIGAECELCGVRDPCAMASRILNQSHLGC